MKVALIYYQLFDRHGQEQLIGGIETYLLNLGNLISELGWQPRLFQCASRPFARSVNGMEVVGVPVSVGPRRNLNVERKILYQAANSWLNPQEDIIIFGADHISVPTKNRRHIAIQHGVSCDLPARYITQKKYCESGPGARLKKWLHVRNELKFFENCYNRVCVDYNFLNFYRTRRSTEPEGRIWVIPNFAPATANPEAIAERYLTGPEVRILFARRFTKYRGVVIMAEAARKILQHYPNVRFTFAGEGPEEGWFREQFSRESRVTFTKFLPLEVMDIHLAHHIAVVPSIGSEGTSLSVAEAMAAGCAVVASAVGGITNMIINGYNGILVMPDATSLFAGLEKLIKDNVLRRQIGERALETAKEAFSLQRWQDNWRQVLEKICVG
jgi:glycosyltransferase involved in cell wall biosynthesis